MPDMDAIARGLAALLRNALPEDEGHVSPYFMGNPPRPSLSVAGLKENGLEFTTFGKDDIEAVFVIEGCFDVVPDSAPSRKLLPLTFSVAQAVMSDTDGTGALTSRLQDDGTVLSGQAAAAQWVKFERYGGQARYTLPNGGVHVLLATWEVRVAA